MAWCYPVFVTVQNINLMPLSHYSRYFPQLRVFFASGTASQVIPFYPSCSGSVIRSYRSLAKHPCPLTTVQDLYSTLRHIGETSMYVQSPYVTIYTPKDDRVTTLCTPWTTPSVTIARNSSAHAQNHLYMLTVPI